MEFWHSLLALPCWIGLHAWNQQVSVSECWGIRRVRGGAGIQKGTQRCRYCPATRLAYRLTRSENRVSRWYACSAYQEKRIDALPPL